MAAAAPMPLTATMCGPYGALGLILGLLLFGANYLYGWLIVGPDTRAEIEITKDYKGFDYRVRIEEKDPIFWWSYKPTDYVRSTNSFPDAGSAYVEALTVAERYGVQDRIRFDDNSVVDESFVLPSQVNVKAVLKEFYDGKTQVRLVSTDYDITAWQYFDWIIDAPSVGSEWPNRQLALKGATAAAEKYDLTITQVVDE